MSVSSDEELDAALAEAERARKMLARIKGKQVRNAEHRDYFKATALSWFRSRRPRLTTLVAADLLEAVDRPYRTFLDATERASAKSTYVDNLLTVKAAMVAARGAMLTAVPSFSNRTAPDFAPLAADNLMRGILIRRWDECQRCIDAAAPLAATVMMGGLLEALFVARVNRLADKSLLFKLKACPIDSKTKKPLDLRQWMLASYIDAGHEMTWISRSAKDVAAVLRDYRNYIHPEKERSHGVVLTADDAAMFWEITKSLSRELLAMKGPV